MSLIPTTPAPEIQILARSAVNGVEESPSADRELKP